MNVVENEIQFLIDRPFYKEKRIKLKNIMLIKMSISII
jgi:hypothetical protein